MHHEDSDVYLHWFSVFFFSHATKLVGAATHFSARHSAHCLQFIMACWNKSCCILSPCCCFLHKSLDRPAHRDIRPKTFRPTRNILSSGSRSRHYEQRYSETFLPQAFFEKILFPFFLKFFRRASWREGGDANRSITGETWFNSQDGPPPLRVGPPVTGRGMTQEATRGQFFMTRNVILGPSLSRRAVLAIALKQKPSLPGWKACVRHFWADFTLG